MNLNPLLTLQTRNFYNGDKNTVKLIPAAVGVWSSRSRQLAEIYNWITEDFDTANLKDAKALLEELNA